MKIGEFAVRYNVSRDTVRHYIKFGLLIPDDTGAQLHFGERECHDMETILRMKSQCFSLVEIRRFLDIYRVSTMVEPESIQDIITLFNQKKKELQQQAQNLMATCTDLEHEVRQLQEHLLPSDVRNDVPISALSLLACPRCGQSLELENASLSHNCVHQGLLRCRCGYHASIEDGIVMTDNRYTGTHDSPDLRRGIYRDVSPDFVTYIQRCTDFALRTLGKMDLHRRVVLENHVNGYFFLYNNLSHLEPDCTYIIIDKYPEILQMYKRNIEQLGLKLNILFIADAGLDFPIRHGAVDVLVSFMGCNEHSLYFQNPYIHDMKPFLNQKAIVLGANLGFHRESRSLRNIRKKYPEGDGNGFCYEDFSEHYRNEGYLVERQPVGVILETSDRFSFECHVAGEELIVSHFLAKPVHKIL